MKDFSLIEFIRIPVQRSTRVILVTFWWRVPHLTEGIGLLGSDAIFSMTEKRGRKTGLTVQYKTP
jgi:hypothetical protein